MKCKGRHLPSPAKTRRIVLLVHLCCTALSGLFLVVLGVTGAIVAFEDDLDRLFNPQLLTVAPGAQPLAVADVLAALRKAYPNAGTRLTLPVAPDRAYAGFAGPTQIFINGYTGKVLGTRPMPTWLGEVHRCHTSLLLGRTGAVLMGIAAIALVVLVGTGLYLWWPLKRATVAFGARLTNFDLHNALGIWAAAFWLLFALTGILIAFDGVLVPLIFTLTGSAPPTRDVPSTPSATGAAISADQAIAAARAALPGAMPFILTSPKDPRGSYSVAMRFPEDLTGGGRSWVIVEQYTAAALFVESSRDPPAGTGIVTRNRALHTGDILGYPSKVVMALTSLALALQVVTGGLLWWKRWRAGRAKR